MDNYNYKKIKPFREGIRIAIIYCIISIIWIIASDTMIFNLFGEDIFAIKEMELIKGIGFVLITTVMIYSLIYHSLNKIIKLDKTIEEKVNMINIKKTVLDEARRGLLKQQSLIDKVISNTSIMILVLDLECRIINANHYFYAFTNYNKEDIKNKKINEFIKDGKNSEFCGVNEGIGSYKPMANREVVIKCKDEIEKYMLLSVSPSKNKMGEIDEFIAIGMDITETKLLEKTIQYLDSFDTVTGLPNRYYLEKKFNNLMKDLDDENNDFAFLYIDIDNFKQVNETFGHHAGDTLLINIGEIIQEATSSRHLVARISNDNFAIILTDVKCKEQINQKVEKLQELIRKSWKFQGEEFFISSTIGISMMKRDERDFTNLLMKANIAMDYCKKNNRASYQYYDEDVQKQVLDNVSMLSDIRKALINKEFTMHYQIIFDMNKNNFYAVESLIRWHHPEKGNIPPMNFIPLAETSSLIYDIRDYVINEVLRQKREWNDKGINIHKVGINISTKSFASEDLVQVIESKLKEYNINSNEVVLEITESGFVENLDNINKNINSFRQSGIQIALDDFGTGYSSLSRLKDLHMDYLKLDRTFLMNIQKDNDAKKMVTSVIFLAHNLGLKVVAEGIETEGQLGLLKALGCDLGQGYYIHKPMSAEDLEKIIM